MAQPSATAASFIPSGTAFRSNLGFSSLPMVTSTCGLEEPGIDPPIFWFWLVDNPLYLPPTCWATATSCNKTVVQLHHFVLQLLAHPVFLRHSFCSGYATVTNFNKTMSELELNHCLCRDILIHLKKLNSSSIAIFSLSCLVFSSCGHIRVWSYTAKQRVKCYGSCMDPVEPGSSRKLDAVSSLLSCKRWQWKSISDFIVVCTIDCSHGAGQQAVLEVGRYSLVRSTATSKFYSLAYRDFFLCIGTSHKLSGLFSALSISGSLGDS